MLNLTFYYNFFPKVNLFKIFELEINLVIILFSKIVQQLFCIKISLSLRDKKRKTSLS